MIDGRNRLRACQEFGLEPKVEEWDGEGSLVDLVVSLNMHRRHLTPSQRATCGTEIEARLAVEAKQRQQAAGPATAAARIDENSSYKGRP